MEDYSIDRKSPDRQFKHLDTASGGALNSEVAQLLTTSNNERILAVNAGGPLAHRFGKAAQSDSDRSQIGFEVRKTNRIGLAEKLTSDLFNAEPNLPKPQTLQRGSGITFETNRSNPNLVQSRYSLDGNKFGSNFDIFRPDILLDAGVVASGAVTALKYKSLLGGVGLLVVGGTDLYKNRHPIAEAGSENHLTTGTVKTLKKVDTILDISILATGAVCAAKYTGISRVIGIGLGMRAAANLYRKSAKAHSPAPSADAVSPNAEQLFR